MKRNTYQGVKKTPVLVETMVDHVLTQRTTNRTVERSYEVLLTMWKGFYSRSFGIEIKSDVVTYLLGSNVSRILPLNIAFLLLE